ncbi:MAG: hypothetical protein NTW25_07590 [Candidatus Kapabacteria bacterium]|nr:hypothetical protein [Candidatus Kapabacteria bacterium]
MVKSIYIFILILLVSCNAGLEPPQAVTVFSPAISGKIVYTNGLNNWPPIDSLKGMRIFFFKEFPDTASILNDITKGNVIFSDSTLPINVSQTNFIQYLKETPVTFKYIAVGQNFSSSLLDWRVVGLYSDDNKTPKAIIIGKDSSAKNIIINVDFKNLPPQPF